MRCARFDEAAIAAVRRARVQRAADIGGSCSHPPEQYDGAVVVLHRARFDHTGVVHYTSQQRILRARGHQYLSAIGLDQRLVLGKVVKRALVDLHLHQAVAVEGEYRGTAGTECDGAELRGDGSLVADGVAEQGNIAAIGGVDRALVDDAAGAVSAEGDRAAIQTGIVDIEGGCDKAPDVDLRALSEQDAVRVDQEYLSVGIEVAEDLCAVGIEDAVDRDGAGRRLQEVDGFLRCDVEALPVKRKILGRLLDAGGGSGLGDAACAGDDLSAYGCGLREGREGQQDRSGQRIALECRLFFTRVGGVRCSRTPCVMCCAQDKIFVMILRVVAFHAFIPSCFKCAPP